MSHGLGKENSLYLWLKKPMKKAGRPIILPPIINIPSFNCQTWSSDLDGLRVASKAVDGKWGSWSSAGTDTCSAWWELDLGESLPVEKVIIVNRKCNDDANCSCKLSHAAVSLIDDQGNTAAAFTTKDTCGKGWIVRKFPTSAANCV